MTLISSMVISRESGISVIIEYPKEGELFHHRNIKTEGVIYACCRDSIVAWGWKHIWSEGSKMAEYATMADEINFSVNISLYYGKNVIEVWAKGSSGLEGSANVTVYYDGPVANAGGPYKAKPGEKIQFHGDVYGGTGPYTWSWDFGDGSRANVQNPSHEYPSYGLYKVSLTVIDWLGRKDTNYTYAVILENIPPHVKIIRPENAVYINDRKTMPFFMPVIIGRINIKAAAYDNETGIAYVEFYAGSKLIANVTSPPYKCEWHGFGVKEIKAYAADYCMNVASDSIRVIAI